MGSCAGCKFLYQHCAGYSNFTVEEYEIKCALDKNPNLPEWLPCDWDWYKSLDNWDKTAQSRCELYSPGDFVCLDVDGEDGPADYTNDEEAIQAICKHSGRERNGVEAFKRILL